MSNHKLIYVFNKLKFNTKEPLPIIGMQYAPITVNFEYNKKGDTYCKLYYYACNLPNYDRFKVAKTRSRVLMANYRFAYIVDGHINII